jgi:uncharacterized protein
LVLWIRFFCRVGVQYVPQKSFHGQPMTFGRASRQATPRFLVVFALVAGVLAAAQPAAAQYWGNNWGDNRYNRGYRSYPQEQQRDFFFPFSGFMRPAPVVDSTKAPPPRKLENPPTSTVVVVGDSMADWLGYGLDEFYTDEPDIGIERKIRAASGLIRYDAKNEALDWPQAIKDALANEKPDAIVVMLGLNDRVALRDKSPPPPSAKRPGEAGQPASPAAKEPASQASPEKSAAPVDTEAPPQAAAEGEAQHPVPGGSYEFHTDQWATLYAKRIDEMIAALKSKGVPIIWVGLPAIRGAKSTSDLSYLDELYRERAEREGIVYVDLWDGFVDDQGRYAVQGPDFEGQTRRLRTADGVHFTKAGAVKLASYVDRELRRALSAHVTPVALPALETAPKPATGTRPDVGPVLPLTTSSGEGGDLAGAAGHPAQSVSDPIAAKVLTHGDPLPAPAGRADDFSWPRPSTAASAAPEAAPQPVAVTPAMPAGKTVEGKKPADAGKDAKSKPAPDSAPGKSHRPGNAELDGAPRPPAPVGSR